MRGTEVIDTGGIGGRLWDIALAAADAMLAASNDKLFDQEALLSW